MEQNDKLKEMKTALNARLFLLFIGIMMVVNAVTSTGRNGLSWLNLASMVTEVRSEAETAVTAETEDRTVAETEAAAAENAAGEMEAETELDIELLATQMDEVGITVGDLRFLGIVCLIVAAFEAIIGMICVLFSNRVDKSKITWRAVITLFVVECLFLIVLFTKGVLMLNNLLNALFLPLVLLWSARKLRKLAKADPTRIYAVKQEKQPVRQAAKIRQAPNKSLKERAMIQAGDEPDEDQTETSEVSGDGQE